MTTEHIKEGHTRETGKSGKHQLQPRDLALLQNLASYRFMNTEQMLALHPGGRRNMLRRIGWLRDEKLLVPYRGLKREALPSRHAVYGLGRKGAELMLDPHDLKEWNARERKIRKPNIPHAMLVSQFRVMLTVAVRNRDGEITRWSDGYDLRDALTLRGRKPNLVPDGFCTVRVGDTQWHFFLEADRGKMDHGRMLDKYRIYWQWHKERTYCDRLGIRYFRVLTTTTGAARRDNLRSTAFRANPGNDGSGLFLFADESDYSLSDSESIFSDIWVCPKDGNRYQILS